MVVGSIHLSIHPYSELLILDMVTGSLESIPRDSGHEVGDSLNRVPHHRAQSHIYTYILQTI